MTITTNRFFAIRARVVVAGVALVVAPSFASAKTAWPTFRDFKRMGGGTKDAAIIAAVEKYAFVPKVPGAVANAVDWYRYLIDSRGVPADRVVLLRNDDVTAETIQQKLIQTARRVEPGGTLWFVFIGHGAPAKDGKDGLLVAFDAQQRAESLFTRSLRRSEVLRVMGASRAAQSMVILDTCFSGRSAKGTSIVPGLQPLVAEDIPPSTDSRTVLFTAARGDEFAGPLPGADRPAFSYLVLGGLRGWADSDGDGRVTVKELGQFSQGLFTTLVSDRKQTPTFEGPPDLTVGRGWEKRPKLEEIVLPPDDPSRTPVVPAIKCPLGMAAIDGGRFQRARGTGVAEVAPFCLDNYEVTVRYYASCVTANQCAPPSVTIHWPEVRADERTTWSRYCNSPRVKSLELHPMNCVSWADAVAFCSAHRKRLASEDEWEWAARGGGAARKYPWGSEEPTTQVCFSGVERRASTCPTGEMRAGRSRDGILDLAGNVWEWTSSRLIEGRKARVIRGGGWFDAVLPTVSQRAGVAPETRDFAIGFRCALTP